MLNLHQISKNPICTLKYFLLRCRKGRTKKKLLQRADLLHIELKLLGQNYQTPFYADCIIKYRENLHKICFSVDSSCNFKVISKSNISKQIYEEEK